MANVDNMRAIEAVNAAATREPTVLQSERSGASSPPLSRHLVLLVAIAVLPLLLVATVQIWRQGEDKRAAREESLHATARVLSVAIDRQLASYRVMLESLANSELVDRGDFAGFHAFASHAAEQQRIVSIALFDPSGKQIVNTRMLQGIPLPNPMISATTGTSTSVPTGDRETLKRVFATGWPRNSDLYYGLTVQQLLFTVNVPVVRDGKVKHVLSAALMPQLVTDLLASDPQLNEVRAVVVDRNGFIVGRWRDADKYTGVRLMPETLALLSQSESGKAVTRTVEGEHVFRAFVRSPQTGWTTLVALDAETLRAEERRTWLVWGSGALAGLLLSLVTAAAFARRLDHSIVALAQAAADDSNPPDVPLRSREIDRLHDALVKAKETRDVVMRAREAVLREEARRVEAESANREKDGFMAAVVHELRTPLAALNNIAAVVQSGVHDERLGPMLQRQVAQLGRLVDDLLETSRINVGKFQLKLARIDLRDVVRQAVEAATMRHRDKRQLLQTTWPSEAVTVEGDAGRLTQVVANLVDNAMKFTPAGNEIRLGLTTHVGHAVLRIVDSGTGIDPEFLPCVFDRFNQGGENDGSRGGLGLGLSVARDLVVAHKGRIEVASEGAGRGTTFTVTLPLA